MIVTDETSTLMNNFVDLVSEFKSVVADAVKPYRCCCCRTAFIFF